MVPEPIHLELSSSDDDDDDLNRPGSTTALVYLSKVFDMDADDDDVRIVEKPTSFVKRDRGRVIRRALDDDECCILDTDPGADAAPDIISPFDTDDLVMTKETGPVACRDFPHARYLCVHFPFKTTLHSKCCAQCHCYVCDSLAPCSLWGEGDNPNDHCHASEEPRWRALRKVAKCGTVSPLATKVTDKTGGSRLVQSNLLQHTAIIPPVTQPPVSTPVGSQASLLAKIKVKKFPLLKGKTRGKPSQHLNLGVRPPSRPHPIIPLSSFPGPRNRPSPRSTSTPSGRLQEVQSPVSTAAQPPPPGILNPGLVRPGVRRAVQAVPRHPHSMPSRNFRPTSTAAGTTDILTRPSEVQIPQSTPNSSAAPNTPSSQSSLPPDANNVSVLQPPGINKTAPAFVSLAAPIPDSRYVPASALRNQKGVDVSLDLSTSLQPQAVHDPSIMIGADYVAQGFIRPVNAVGFSPADILAGPIEGWDMDAGVEFTMFAAGIRDVRTSPEHMTTSLHDLVQQMADDDYLWEQFPGWYETN